MQAELDDLIAKLSEFRKHSADIDDIKAMQAKVSSELSAWLVSNAAVNAKFQSSSGPVDISGPAYCAQNGGIVLPFNAGGWFATAPGDSLILNLSSGVAVGGSLSYILV